ncbi:peptidase M15 [Caulobacter flavus]|uniref:D-alanyl-D-alanine dipeptidase n=1 Tax=Caulobacter flavus TaxID=1679497 RepID=A0A2N5CMA7_9CAUL|nr:M15 family metallopeptidase [Caulobacter flavus]AYV48062.1 peptidase M15 [Caulobacter flavus]PLR07014.1 peptidase M15 [Caulobacter flavus]
MRQTRRTVAAGVLASGLAPGAALAAADLSLVAQYGAPEAPLTVFETGDGQLAVFAYGRPPRRLSPLAASRYAVEGGGELLVTARGVRLDGAVLPRRDFGAEVQAGIRRAVRADSRILRERALAATPPTETGDFLPADLVNLATVGPGFRFDIRYAGRDNFMGLKLYERPAAWLQRPAAEALGRAAKALAGQGYGLTIHDAYRPWFVTWMFWEATPPASRVVVADPAKGSRHNRGCAVDLTLHDLATGAVVEMPSRYDEMSTRSYADFAGGTARQRALRGMLRDAMVAQGFEVYPEEWWHFDFGAWRRYPIGVKTFTQLAGRV